MTKPDTRQAMHRLIRQIQRHFELPADDGRLCAEDDCRVCRLKLLQYLESELENWRQRLDQGRVPHFGDLAALENTARKIHNAIHGRVKEDKSS